MILSRKLLAKLITKELNVNLHSGPRSKLFSFNLQRTKINLELTVVNQFLPPPPVLKIQGILDRKNGRITSYPIFSFEGGHCDMNITDGYILI